MASIPCTFQGVLFFSDIGVGGGPILGGPGGQPPGIWPSPGHPSHPIAPGGQPPGIWGGAPPYVDIGFPGQQPGVSHPIAPGGQPPYPSQGPGFPTAPIVLPPYEPGGPPVTIWPSPGRPTHPIVIPPPPENPPEGGKPPPEGQPGWGYHPDYGWGFFPSGTPGPK
jgi:hypothetical protein